MGRNPEASAPGGALDGARRVNEDLTAPTRRVEREERAWRPAIGVKDESAARAKDRRNRTQQAGEVGVMKGHPQRRHPVEGAVGEGQTKPIRLNCRYVGGSTAPQHLQRGVKGYGAVAAAGKVAAQPTGAATKIEHAPRWRQAGANQAKLAIVDPLTAEATESQTIVLVDDARLLVELTLVEPGRRR